MFDEFKISVIIEMNMIMMGVHQVRESFAFSFEIVVTAAFEIVHSEKVHSARWPSCFWNSGCARYLEISLNGDPATFQ